jgi:hypothetical protein
VVRMGGDGCGTPLVRHSTTRLTWRDGVGMHHILTGSEGRSVVDDAGVHLGGGHPANVRGSRLLRVGNRTHKINRLKGCNGAFHTAMPAGQSSYR